MEGALEMGQEELSAVYSGDNESYNNFRFKLRRCGLKWVPIMTVWEPCTKKRAKQGLKDIITEKDSSTEENLSNEHRQDAILGRSCSSQFVLENQSHASLTVVGKINYTCSKKREYNNQISAIPADNCLTNVEELLSTGILEGARVKYVSTSGNVKLLGIIKDGGYQCSCSICTMSKVLSAHEFELHAGGKSRNPHNHIYLDNGNSIYRIIEELWTTPLNMLEEVIKRVAGSSVNEEQLWTWKASLHQNKKLAKSYEDCNRKFLGMNNSSTGLRSCPSTVREGEKNTVGRARKRTNALHSLLFSPGGLQDGTILKYCVKEKVLRMGYKQEKGVICCCCGTKFSPSDFEKHAKHSRKRQPYNYIFTTNGHTLHNIAVDLLEGKSIESIVPSSSDDKCAVCRVAGGLVCDGCSRAHRPVCFRLEVPTRDWHCPNCTKNIGHGGRDPSPVNLHPHQVVMQPVYQPGDCVICRNQVVSVEACDGQEVIQCYQCAKQYHVACCLADGSYEIIKSPKDIWFCCCDCKRIHLTMQSRLKGNKGLALNKKLIVDGAANSLHCQILSVKSSTTEDSRLLCKAATLFNECFKTLSSKAYPDLIAAMVRGKNISEWESRQIFCVVLIVDSMVASVGVLRIISGEIAELPVVATTKRYRGKGHVLLAEERQRSGMEGVIDLDTKMEDSKHQDVEIEEAQVESSCSEAQLLPKDETVLELLDSINNYLLLMDSLSSKLRDGWFELAGARQSMGSSRVSSALFDLKYHHAATLMEVDHGDADSNLKQPHFTLHKWLSTDNQEFSPEGGKFEEDELLQRKSSSPHSTEEHQEKRSENGPEVLSSPSSPYTPNSNIKKERAKSLSMFGTLVSPKLRDAQLSFETVLETLQEVANVRSSMLAAYEQVLKEIEISKI